MRAKSELLCTIDCVASVQVVFGRRQTGEDFGATCMCGLSPSVCRYGSKCRSLEWCSSVVCCSSVGLPRSGWSQQTGTSDTRVCDCLCAEQVDVSGPIEHMQYTHCSCTYRSITEALSNTIYKDLIGQFSSMCQLRRRP